MTTLATPPVVAPAATPAAPAAPATNNVPQAATAAAATPAPAPTSPVAQNAEPAKAQAYEIKPGEGHSAAVAADFAKFAVEAGLPADKAQAGYDALSASFMASVQKQAAETQAAWAAEVQAHPELGGDKLPQTKALAAKALELAPEGVREFLNSSGLGNHPGLVAWAARVGQALSPDTFIAGQRTAAPADLRDPAVQAQRLYPNHK